MRNSKPQYVQLIVMAVMIAIGLFAVVRVVLEMVNPDPHRGFMGLPKIQSELKDSK